MASTKKGFPIQFLNKYGRTFDRSSATDQMLANAPDMFNANAAWTWNWSNQTPQFVFDELTSKGIDYTPCIWNSSFKVSDALIQQSVPKYMLGYNEPDQSGQANMTTTQVIDAWGAMADSVPAGTILVGPAISDGQFAFMNTVYSGIKSSGYRLDAVGMHLYRTDLSSFAFGSSAYSIPSMADTYGVPIVVSEFGYTNWTRTSPYPDSEVSLILSNILDFTTRCEASDDVARYCLYPAPSPYGRYHAWFNFMTNIGGRYTELYKQYAAI